ncbi:ATP-binding protein [Marinilactibacillus psychrotolerans]|uniref:ATP-binding protein n=1 Tax=Marinilactibacillus psychrotolerans TaxID=191770 RepID=UPI00388AD3A5
MGEIELLPYAPNLVESTRSIGYSFETALADIIDNSVSNYSSRVDVKFSGGECPYVAVIDDGVGMSEYTLKQAMRYGSKSSLEERDEIDLGRFGLGLKMASMSQCRKLTVLSKQRGEITAVTWDLDHIHETEKWNLITYSKDQTKKLKLYDDLDNMKSGTVVLWEKLDRISESVIKFDSEFNEVLSYSSKHMGLVFHRYIENPLMKNYFELYFNNLKVDPIDPFMTSNKGTQELEEETLFIDKVGIKVKPFIIPYASKLSAKERQIQNENKDLNINQGLYIYRNKRLIVWGKWFYLLREAELSKLARIRIDLPNSIDDIWTIDVKKSSASIPSTIKEPLKQIVIRSVGKSERVFRYRGRKANKDNKQHVWNKIENREKFQFLINRDLSIYKALEESLDDNQLRLLNSLVRSLEDTFPYGDVYFELAKDREYETNTQTVDEVYQSAKNILEMYTGNIKIQKVLLAEFKRTDLFSNYPEVIKMVESELE